MNKKQPPLYFKSNLLDSQSFITFLRKHKGRCALIADEKIGSLYGKSFVTFMTKQGLECPLITFPGGEQSKTRETKESLEDQLLAHQLGRDTLLIVMGGGVTTDIGGFVAATYLRKVPFLSIPTSLLAMVDASLGGKVGVNVKEAKNIIGTFYSPLAIFIDLSFLATLPNSEILCGSAEIIKAALIGDKRLFKTLYNKCELWKKREKPLLKKVVRQSIAIKRKIIKSDPEEKGKRRILNFGHTIGHAIETLEDYRLPHGEAIAIGIIVESLIAHKLKALDASDFNAIYQLIQKMGFSLKLSKKVTSIAMQEAMIRDKKTKNKTPRFVILNGIGKVRSFKRNYCTTIDQEILDEALGWMISEFQSQSGFQPPGPSGPVFFFDEPN